MFQKTSDLKTNTPHYESAIYAFSTLGNDPFKSPIMALSVLPFFNVVSNPDTPEHFQRLVNATTVWKFDVAEQLRMFDRVMHKSAESELQKPHVKLLAKPSQYDISVNMLPNIFAEIKDKKQIFTRGNTFAPVVLSTFLQKLDLNDVYDWWKVRDVRSFVEGLAFGSDLQHNFVPKGAQGHVSEMDPRHNVALDAMRIQVLASEIEDEEIPF